MVVARSAAQWSNCEHSPLIFKAALAYFQRSRDQAALKSRLALNASAVRRRLTGYRKSFLNSRLPLHLQVLTPRVFHPNRYVVIPSVFYLNRNATSQAPVTRIFNLNQPSNMRALAARVFHCSRHDFAPVFFHIYHHVFGQALAYVRHVSEWVSL
jgi:hypothetical protein